MENFNRIEHWENIYNTKQLNEVSWYQTKPITSLENIKKFAQSKSNKIIDVGGGDSFLVDHLLKEGFMDITVLDISSKSIERAKSRLGSKAERVKWIVSDITAFNPSEQYDIWHDRAAFHFLNESKDIDSYVHVANESIVSNGSLFLGTFSENGPKKCSGIEIKQYSEHTLSETFKDNFQKQGSFYIDHKTPFDTVQNFVFCSFKKLK